MRQFKRTALSLAAAQTLVVWMAPAIAQNTAAPAAAPAPAKDAQQLETVMVSGRRAALATAQKIKQDSDEIVDSVVAEDIGKLPDRSVTEVLQRVVGVAMDRVSASSDPVHFSAEGSGVVIRGLTYVSSTLNGRETFSANQGRTLGFEDMPPELMAGVDVYKNPSAEQIEGAIGGLVNLRTALPFDFNGFKASLSGNVTHNSLNGKSKPSVSGLLSNTWNTDLGKFGALIDVAHSLSSARTDGIVVDPYYIATPTSTQWNPRDIGWRQQSYDRTRDGLYGALQWRKGDVESSLSFFRSKYQFDWNEFNVIAQINPYNVNVLSGSYDANGVLQKGVLTGKQNADGSYQGIEVENQTRFSKRASQTDELAWKIGGKVNDQLTLTSDFQYIRSKTNNFDSTVGTAVQLPKETIDLTGSLPRLVFDASDLATLNDPSKYYWSMMMEHLDKGKGTQKSWKGDARWVFKDNPVLNDLRVGVRIAERDAETINSSPSYNWASVTHAWQLGWNIKDLAWIANTDIPTFKNNYNGYFGGKYNLPALYFPAPSVAFGWPNSYQKLHQLYLQQCAALTHPDWGWKPGVTGCDQWNSAQGGVQWAPATFTTDPAGRNSQKETTTAVYSQLRFSFDELGVPMDGNVGLRVVRTRNEADGYTTMTAAVPPAGAVGLAVPPLTSGGKAQNFNQSFTDVLPSLNLKYKANAELQFRFAAAKAIARPQFSQMQAYLPMTQSIEVDPKLVPPTVTKVSQTGNAAGNPLLKPIESTQEDLTAEWYFARNGSLTVAAFNKDLKNIIVNQAFNQTVIDNNGKPTNFVLNGPVNGAKGYARGLEFAYQQYFDHLPDWLQGLGLQANYTYVDSKMTRYNAVYSKYCSPGQGQDNLNLYINGCDTDARTFGDVPLANLSKNTFNLALLYDRGPVSARVAYSWRGKYLYGVALNSDNTGPNQTNALDTNPASPTYGKHDGDANNIPLGLPLWADGYGQVDAGLHYKFDSGVSVGFEAQNLTNRTYKQFMQQHIGMLGHNYFTSGRSYTVTMQYSF
ncbi:TonB-dependent receptor [Pelomonas aquatica]|jgi:iron complex outermembrane receptor protein|uniref:TonB-dependent receptor n=1 Tax=Pelomonas aquatica TaxID=431058 RepID=A0A9X4LLS6_9BURK|nr:TonB-dependent receptor [Pelomonas aquatica]MCY4757172.1 TonB-dependent receptor [Pelomonas aquatica]MDG0865149.1 TonB-dependent receptor [Pelomonas aquatica]